MALSYNKLWKLLIDKQMKKKDLQNSAKVSAGLITKLGKNAPVTTKALIKICYALQCDIGDVMEIVPDEEKLKPESETLKGR
jgi:DNA-binding Xre family transcriptional regulator